MMASRSYVVRFAVLISATIVVLFASPNNAAAQGTDVHISQCWYWEFLSNDVCGFVAITANTTSTEIDTFATETTNNGVILLGSGEAPLLIENIFDSNLTIRSGTGNVDSTGTNASLDLSAPISVGNSYCAQAFSELWDPPTYPYNQPTEVGWVKACISTSPPQISSISPTYAYVGTSGQITVTGTNLLDGFGISYPSFSSGSAATPMLKPGGSSTQIVISYTISQNAITGPTHVQLATRFGIVRSSQTFNIGDPTPSITAISNTPWQNGNQYNVTITGTGFGTNPGVSVTGTGVSIVKNSSTPTSIAATVTLTSGAPNGTSMVQVQSQGYNGAPFYPAISGGSAFSNAFPVNVQGVTVPMPQLYLFGNTLTTSPTSPQSVVVGQLIGLTETTASLPSGYSYMSQTWSLPGDGTVQTAVGGYMSTDGLPNPDTTGGCVEQIQGQSIVAGACSTNILTTGTGYSFYYVSSFDSTGALLSMTPVSYSYTAADTMGDKIGASATAYFNVTAPSVVSVTVTPGPEAILPPSILPTFARMNFGPGGAPAGSPFPGNQGMSFTASLPDSSSPVGTFQWVQLIVSDASRILVPSGVITNPTSSGLDGGYPYGYNPRTQTAINPPTVQGPLNSQAADSPSVFLVAGAGEEARSFSAGMYLMWVPSSVISGCTLLCDIPVPLGMVNWQYTGDAINTQDDGAPPGAFPQWPNWLLTGPGPGWNFNSGFIYSQSFPVWTTYVPLQ
jgi:hypothetical protein